MLAKFGCGKGWFDVAEQLWASPFGPIRLVYAACELLACLFSRFSVRPRWPHPSWTTGTLLCFAPTCHGSCQARGTRRLQRRVGRSSADLASLAWDWRPGGGRPSLGSHFPSPVITRRCNCFAVVCVGAVPTLEVALRRHQMLRCWIAIPERRTLGSFKNKLSPTLKNAGRSVELNGFPFSRDTRTHVPHARWHERGDDSDPEASDRVSLALPRCRRHRPLTTILALRHDSVEDEVRFLHHAWG